MYITLYLYYLVHRKKYSKSNTNVTKKESEYKYLAHFCGQNMIRWNLSSPPDSKKVRNFFGASLIRVWTRNNSWPTKNDNNEKAQSSDTRRMYSVVTHDEYTYYSKNKTYMWNVYIVCMKLLLWLICFNLVIFIFLAMCGQVKFDKAKLVRWHEANHVWNLLVCILTTPFLPAC